MKKKLKETVTLFLSEPTCKESNARYTTVSLKFKIAKPLMKIKKILKTKTWISFMLNQIVVIRELSISHGESLEVTLTVSLMNILSVLYRMIPVSW